MVKIAASDHSTDWTAVCALAQSVLPQDVCSPEQFQRKVLCDPNFCEEGAIVATDGDNVVGFCLAIARQVPLENALSDIDRGYLTLLGVDQSYRRQGVAKKMVLAAEVFLREEGKASVWVSPYAPNYFTPGVDINASASALTMYMSLGYEDVNRPLAMAADLSSITSPSWICARGFAVMPCDFGRSRELIRFAHDVFRGDWVRFVRDALRGASNGKLLVAVDGSSNSIVGFAHYDGERFGPIGVAPEHRGRGIGQMLTLRVLEAQRSDGHGTSWFMWTDDRTAERLYNGFGFRETRRFALLKKLL